MGLLFILLLTLAKIYAEDFKHALPGRIFSFPQDHLSHPEFKTEWWYYSGHLKSLTHDEKSHGYQFTFFRTGLKRDVKNQKSKKKEFQIEVLDQWKSSRSGAIYPSKWRVRIPGHGIECILSPTVKNQELITKESTRVTYWEGSVKVEGKYQGDPINGMGYVELTGFAGPFSKGI